jgi:hypothetical protein
MRAGGFGTEWTNEKNGAARPMPARAPADGDANHEIGLENWLRIEPG